MSSRDVLRCSSSLGVCAASPTARPRGHGAGMEVSWTPEERASRDNIHRLRAEAVASVSFYQATWVADFGHGHSRGGRAEKEQPSTPVNRAPVDAG
eukprot:3020915-Prymnesium_polylepis.1